MWVQSTHTSYSFLCLRCGRSWSSEYDVRIARDRAGNEWRVYFHGSTPLAAPDVGVMCSACGGLRVKLLPPAARVATTSSPESP